MADNKKTTAKKGTNKNSRSQKKAKQKRNRVILIAIEALVILVAVVAAVVIYAMDKKGGNEGVGGSNLISTEVKKENLAVNEELEVENYWV